MSRAQIGVNVSRCCYQVVIHGGWGGGAESQDLCEVLHRVLTLMSVSSLSGGTDSGWMGLKKTQLTLKEGSASACLSSSLVPDLPSLPSSIHL